MSGGRWPCFSESSRPTLMTPREPVEDRLPTEHELPADDRVNLESKRLNALLTRLKTLLKASSGPELELLPELKVITDPPGKSEQEDSLMLISRPSRTANFRILKSLACAGREYGVAYQLGRSLRDTANPPPRPDAVADGPGSAGDKRPGDGDNSLAAVAGGTGQEGATGGGKACGGRKGGQAEAEKQAEAEAARQALRHQLAGRECPRCRGGLPPGAVPARQHRRDRQRVDRAVVRTSSRRSSTLLTRGNFAGSRPR